MLRNKQHSCWIHMDRSIHCDWSFWHQHLGSHPFRSMFRKHHQKYLLAQLYIVRIDWILLWSRDFLASIRPTKRSNQVKLTKDKCGQTIWPNGGARELTSCVATVSANSLSQRQRSSLQPGLFFEQSIVPSSKNENRYLVVSGLHVVSPFSSKNSG